MNPRWQPTAAVFLILGIIVAWTAIVASLAGMVSRWPALVQTLFYTVAGLIWIVPLKPILRWGETGRWRDEGPQG